MTNHIAKMKYFTSLSFIVALLLASCEQSANQEIQDEPNSPTLFSLMSPEESGFDLQKSSESKKLQYF